jgi:hypothetical protein
MGKASRARSAALEFFEIRILAFSLRLLLSGFEIIVTIFWMAVSVSNWSFRLSVQNLSFGKMFTARELRTVPIDFSDIRWTTSRGWRIPVDIGGDGNSEQISWN